MTKYWLKWTRQTCNQSRSLSITTARCVLRKSKLSRGRRKIKWLRKLYRDAKNAEIIAEQGEGLNPDSVQSAKF